MLSSVTWRPLIVVVLMLSSVMSSDAIASIPSTPIQTVLSIDSYPPIGQQATLTCEISSVLDAPGTTAQIELPANARLLSGNLNWEGDLLADKLATFSAAVVFDAEGDTAIYCRALRMIDAENSWGDLAALYLSIGQTSSKPGLAKVPREDQGQFGELTETGDDQSIDEAGIPQTLSFEKEKIVAYVFFGSIILFTIIYFIKKVLS